METTALRALVEQARRTYYPNAAPWPNGLGFYTQGWDFGYGESRSIWVVTKTRRGILVRGEGNTPAEAYFNARPVKE